MSTSSFIKNPQKALGAIAVVMLVGVPSTLTQISDPVIRLLCTLLGVLLVFWIGWKLKPPDAQKVSIRPPSPSIPNIKEEPVTLRDLPPKE